MYNLNLILTASSFIMALIRLSMAAWLYTITPSEDSGKRGQRFIPGVLELWLPVDFCIIIMCSVTPCNIDTKLSCFLKKPPKPGSKVRSRDPGVMIIL